MSTSPLPTVLVVGATGKQGGAVITSLLASSPKVHIRALTRNPSSPSALSLASKGVTLVQGSFGDHASLVAALQGVSAAFLVTDPMGKSGVKGEIKDGKAFIDAAKEAGCAYIVFSSVEGAERNSGVPHFESKFLIEKYLEQTGISATILRPVAFMENFTRTSNVGTFFAFGLFEAGARGKPVQLIATKDIGHFAAQALLAPSAYAGRVIKLAGDELTVSQMCAAYTKAQGHAAWKAWLPSFILYLLPFDLRQMFFWFGTHGYTVDIPALKVEYPGLTTFAEWLGEKSA